MSRHSWTDVEKNHLIVVGHDRPLQHFFCQVEDLGADEDCEEDERFIRMDWTGTPLAQIISYLADNGYMPPFEVASTLINDQLTENQLGRSLDPIIHNA